MTRVDSFLARGAAWSACEDLQTPGGALLLLSSGGEAEWFSKTYAPYGTNATDSEYYLGLDRRALANASTDLLGSALLQAGHHVGGRRVGGAPDPYERPRR